MTAAVRIPKDPEARARLAQMAGLTDEERLALDQWCDQQQTEYEARLRRAIEEVGDTPMACGQPSSDTHVEADLSSSSGQGNQ
jgi:hypothetical protein